MRPRTIRGDNLAIAIEIRGVKELEVGVAEGAPWGQVPTNVVQLAEAVGEGDVGVVCEVCVAKDCEAILVTRQPHTHIYESEIFVGAMSEWM